MWTKSGKIKKNQPLKWNQKQWVHKLTTQSWRKQLKHWPTFMKVTYKLQTLEIYQQ